MMLCAKWTCTRVVSFIVIALAMLGLPNSSLADEILWAPLWKGAFHQEYVPGSSGMMLGAELAPGVYELVVYDAAPGETQTSIVGTVTIHGIWALAWHGGAFAPINDTIDGYPTTGTAAATFTSMSATISTFTGFTSPMAGIGQNLSLHIEAGGASEDYAFSTFMPNSVHETVEKASDAAYAFSIVPTTDLPYVPVDPGDDSQEGCANRCWNTYALAVNTAQNNLNSAIDGCGWATGLFTGCGGGCALCGAGFGLGPAGCVGCCLAGGALGAAGQYYKCVRDARIALGNAIANAKTTYAACMANCGIVVAWG